MTFTDEAIALANELRDLVQDRTATIDAAETVTLLLWWSFICDHALNHEFKPEWLAEIQLQAFITDAAPRLAFIRGERH